MKAWAESRLLIGAIALVGIGLLANAAVMLLRPAAAPMPVLAFSEAGAQPGDQGSILRVAGRGQFLTTNSNGDTLYLWFVWENPTPANTTVQFVKSASAR